MRVWFRCPTISGIEPCIARYLTVSFITKSARLEICPCSGLFRLIRCIISNKECSKYCKHKTNSQFHSFVLLCSEHDNRLKIKRSLSSTGVVTTNLFTFCLLHFYNWMNTGFNISIRFDFDLIDHGAFFEIVFEQHDKGISDSFCIYLQYWHQFSAPCNMHFIFILIMLSFRVEVLCEF